MTKLSALIFEIITCFFGRAEFGPDFLLLPAVLVELDLGDERLDGVDDEAALAADEGPFGRHEFGASAGTLTGWAGWVVEGII